ncbi:MAG: vanadium-dependent haloperoxidase [Chitinophagaceae bacterium]|nr:vanadium-dependent haloperoxidase [Chitinophagaceae bacterium]
MPFALLLACNSSGPKIAVKPDDIPVLWANMTLFITKNTPANSPTFASRALGYIGLAMYESVVPGYNGYHSMAGQLNQLGPLPKPDAGRKYNWPLSLNAGQAYILKAIYSQTSDDNKRKIDSLEEAIAQQLVLKEDDQKTNTRSVNFGRAIARAIYGWSVSDGGHRGYLFNFDNKLVLPEKKGSWKAPFFAQTINHFPLHPHWGQNRTFLVRDTSPAIPEIIPYNTDSVSDCFKQFMAVYKANTNLTTDQKAIALWWNDDPSETYTPPGHSYNLATIVIKNSKPGLIRSAETYARVGMAVADAFIICWKLKYIFFSERPSSYVSENIDDEWEPFWPDPPFPAFPSGHATQASAVAEVLTDLYGEPYSFTDDSHTGRPMNALRNVEYKSRKFSSFRDAAKETAYSRFLGGIHTAQDNAVGLESGKTIGSHIDELKWTN